VDYVPGDFTLTAHAGTTLADIARLTAAHHQWLPLDPFGSDQGTLGASVATASAGPLAHAYGTPRDQVLGLEAVTGTGAVIRAGGRVVKNVAGFDLTRLFTGSWGTLGVITEVSVRLRALPAEQAHIAVRLPDDRPGPLGEVVRAAREVRAEPLAMELVNAALAERLALPAATTLLVRLGGNAAALAAQVDAVAAIGRADELDPTVWNALRVAEPAAAMVVRSSGRPSEVPGLWTAVATATAPLPHVFLHATIGRGLVRAIVPDAPSSELAGAMERIRLAGTVAIERFPAALWPAILESPRASEPDDAVRQALLRRVKDAYDPMHLLNPGLLGAGIG
jgi:FAD/FMN-containing dehydrogenase